METRAPKQILLRRVPDDIGTWIEQERAQNKMSQREFIISMLSKAREQFKPDPLSQPSSPKEKQKIITPSFRFVDLFAGIGGFRIALEKLGGQCVFSCEWDRYAQKTYKAWFGEIPHGDIREIKPQEIPDHEVLAAGFPCQPFSIAGVSKKKSLGQAHGFKDRTQGNLFFYLATIIEVKRPSVIFLENVKHLRSHDHGRTWKIIRETLEDMQYRVFDEIVDAAHWVPQHRERIFIVCFDKKVFGENPPFEFLNPPKKRRRKLSDILEADPDQKYTLSRHLWEYLQDYAKRHRERGNGFGFGIADPNGITRTLSARYHKDGSEILIRRGRGQLPRRLTPRECARLMGFPEAYRIVVSDTQAYRQFGNAVIPPLVEAIGRQILKVGAGHFPKRGKRQFQIR